MDRENLEKYVLEIGASKVGFGNMEGYLPEKYSHLKTGISFCIRLSDQIMDEIENEPTHTYFHHYRTVNRLIDHIGLMVSLKLQEMGYLALPIPSSQSINLEGYDYAGLFQHRTAATRAGLGWIGKNACLITEEFGPRIRLGTILTNMPVSAYAEPINESKCGSCRLCVSKCPSLALVGNNWALGLEREEIVNAQVCSRHMAREYKHIGRGVVCGICVKSCPVGIKRIK